MPGSRRRRPPGPAAGWSTGGTPADAVRLAIGLVLLGLTALPVGSERVRTTEENVFRLVNDLPLPGWLWPVVWLLMQFGNFGAVPPGGRPSTAAVRRALSRAGLKPVDVQELGGVDAPRAAYFAVRPDGGPDLFVKLVPRERRDNDVVARAWRRLGPGPPVGPPAQQVAHEAAMALLAQVAGVRTPVVELVRSVGSGAGLYAYRWVPGRVLADLPAEELTDELLVELWRQVAVLHEARIAHGDLGPQSVVVAGDGAPWLIDFSHAEAAAEPARLDRDAARLLGALAALVGPERAAATARQGLGTAADRAAAVAGRRQPGRWARISSTASAP